MCVCVLSMCVNIRVYLLVCGKGLGVALILNLQRALEILILWKQRCMCNELY